MNSRLFRAIVVFGSALASSVPLGCTHAVRADDAAADDDDLPRSGDPKDDGSSDAGVDADAVSDAAMDHAMIGDAGLDAHVDVDAGWHPTK